MKTFTTKITVILFLFMALVACNKEEAVPEKPITKAPVAENPDLENTPSENSITGVVKLPEGSNLDSSMLTILSPVDAVEVSNDSYTMNTVADKFLTQLVTDSNDEVVLMGYSFPGQTDFEINAKSTALAMLMNLPTSLLMAQEGKQELITTILNHPEFIALADQIDALLVQGQRPLDTTEQELAEAVGNFYNGIFNTQTNKTGKSDDESYPVEIRRTNNEIIFTNPGKSYDTKIGIYKDGQAVHQITMDRINFVPTGIGDVIGAIASAITGEIPTGLQPVEKSYTLEGDGEFTIKVRNGFWTNGLDSDNVAAWISNMTGWSIDLLVEIIPLGDCVQPLISDFKEFMQTALTFQEAPAPGELLGLIYNLISEFLNDSVIVVGCLINPTENKAYLKALGKLTNFTGLVGVFGNAGNTMVGMYQWFTDDGALDKCYQVEGEIVNECDVTGVYVAGFEYNQNNIPVAKIWKNGIATSLTNGNFWATANAVFVTDKDVYVVGFEKDANSGNIAKIWKNGVPASLPGNNAIANSIYILENDIYICGRTSINNKSVATVWKNGVSTRLNSEATRSEAMSIFVSGNDVYVAGYIKNNLNYDVATVWKNGVATSLSDGTSRARANSVYVNNNDVYVAGEGGNVVNVATVWKNGIATSLTDDIYGVTGFAYSVYVSNNDVFVTGSEHTENGTTGKVWKNGEETSLPLPFPKSIYVADDDVYVAGSGGGATIGVWKNGEVVLITDGSRLSAPHSIFVKE